MRIPTLALTLFAVTTSFAGPTKNPLGFVYDLPEGWKVVATKDVFQIIQRPGQTENEIYIIGGMLAMGAKTPFDQNLIDEDERLMKELGPWRRVGELKRVPGLAGEGLYEHFKGATSGVDFDGHLFTTLVQKKRCGLLAVVPEGITDKVAADCLAIAGSFRQDPNRKPGGDSVAEKEWVDALAGYKFVQSKDGDHGSLNGCGGEASEKSLILYQDGTFYFASSRTAFASAGEFSTMSESKSKDSGNWSVRIEGEKVFLILESEKGTLSARELGVKGGYVTIDGVVYNRINP